MPDLAAFFQSVKLPVMSEVAHALIQTLGDEDASTTVISNIISKDPALTIKLLRVRARNLKQYSAFVLEKLYKTPGVLDIRSNIVMQTLKDTNAIDVALLGEVK